MKIIKELQNKLVGLSPENDDYKEKLYRFRRSEYCDNRIIYKLNIAEIGKINKNK